MRTRLQMIATIAVAGVVLAACSSSPGAYTATQAPTPVAATEAPSAAASEAPSAVAGTAVEAKEVGAIGNVLVASSNGMTVYIFTKDVKDGGTSACTGGCIDKWPALTVPAGTTPAGGAGVTGELGTITRDDGSLQVTYKGLPLYFFKNDKAPGDANGVYENWEAVKP